MTDSQPPVDTGTQPAGGATTLPTRSAVGIVVDGRYRIVDPLAAGGMGSVYLGEQDNLHRKVAIKLVKQPDADDAERFRREAEALGAISHPAIVEVHDYLEDADAEVSYLVMAYVDGENVADYQATRPSGVLPPLEALELLLPVASALVELHTHGILHRDIKPANLVRYVRADGRAAVKLVDFGIARREQDPGLTADGLIVGTPPYLSPEVILGKKHSEASDVFAFGAMLYEVLSGTPPHGNDDLHKILKRAIHDDVRLPPELMGTGLGALLLRTLAREESDRPSMQGVLEEMERLRLSMLMEHGETAAAMEATRALSSARHAPQLGETSAEAPPVPPASGPTAMVHAPSTAPAPPRRSSAPWVVSGLAVAVALGVTLFFTLRSSPRAGGGDTRTSAAENTAPSPGTMAPRQGSTRPRPAGGRAAAMGPQRPRSALQTAAAVARIHAQCTDMNKAYRLFKKANYLYKLNKEPAWVRATFTALLRCEHTQLKQKRWVAYRLTRILVKAGECAQATTIWRRYAAIARKLGYPPTPQPSCPAPARR